MADVQNVTDTKQLTGIEHMLSLVLAVGDNAPTLDWLIMAYVHAALRLTRGDRTPAARRLGITRWRLRRLLDREAA